MFYWVGSALAKLTMNTNTKEGRSMVTFAQLVADVGDGDGWDHMWGWGGGWMWLWGVLVMASFVLLIVWLVRATSVDSSRLRDRDAGPTDRAREILAERYARGDLTSEEYRERVSDLR